MKQINLITSEQALEIFMSREPEGLFYLVEIGFNGEECFVGIDNTTGDAWTEGFSTLPECISWLNGEFETFDRMPEPEKAPEQLFIVLDAQTLDEPSLMTLEEIREFLSNFWSKDSERWHEEETYQEWLEEVREAKTSDLFNLLHDLDYRVFTSEEERQEWYEEMGLIDEPEEEEEEVTEEEIFKIILDTKQRELNGLYAFIEELQIENSLLKEKLNN